MKKVFTNSLSKFLLVNFLGLMFFSFFGFVNIAVAGSPAQINSNILSDTDNRVISKKITGNSVQTSSFMTVMIPKVFKLVFYIASSLAVFSIIYGGYLMLTSLGESGQHGKGWKVFSFSIIGLVLMLFSRAIVGIVSNLKIVKTSGDTSVDNINGIDYGLGGSSYIGSLPSGKIETDVIPQLIQLALQSVFIVVVGIVIYSGIMYIARTEDNKKEMGDLFINAVVGLILILTSYVLVAGILKINFG